MKTETVIKADHINSVLLAVRASAPQDASMQLSILSLALVAVCRQQGIGKATAMQRMREAFNTALTMTPAAPPTGGAGLH